MITSMFSNVVSHSVSQASLCFLYHESFLRIIHLKAKALSRRKWLVYIILMPIFIETT